MRLRLRTRQLKQSVPTLRIGRPAPPPIKSAEDALGNPLCLLTVVQLPTPSVPEQKSSCGRPAHHSTMLFQNPIGDRKVADDFHAVSRRILCGGRVRVSSVSITSNMMVSVSVNR